MQTGGEAVSRPGFNTKFRPVEMWIVMLETVETKGRLRSGKNKKLNGFMMVARSD